MSKKRKKHEASKHNKIWLWILLGTIFLSTLLISSIKIILWQIDNHNSSKLTDEINNIIKPVEVKDNENTELISQEEDSLSDYWYYIKFPLISIDFDELIKKNSDTIGWINVNNTNINYPIVQTDNNSYYLNHSYDKSNNEAGWVFLDYRNNANFNNKNTIVYAHSRLDKTMFGSLSKTLNTNWYTNKDNHIIRISNKEENSLWQIFSVYVIETETYYLTTSFNNDNDYTNFLEELESRSKYDFNTSLNKDDRILTLSTCYDDNRKTVVHAKLIKKESR